MDESLIETWAIHNRINLYLLTATPEDVLGTAAPPATAEAQLQEALLPDRPTASAATNRSGTAVV